MEKGIKRFDVSLYHDSWEIRDLDIELSWQKKYREFIDGWHDTDWGEQQVSYTRDYYGYELLTIMVTANSSCTIDNVLVRLDGLAVSMQRVEAKYMEPGDIFRIYIESIRKNEFE